jgi:hypothetical protein
MSLPKPNLVEKALGQIGVTSKNAPGLRHGELKHQARRSRPQVQLENARRSLTAWVQGRTITNVTSSGRHRGVAEDSLPSILGCRVEALSRLGKYLIMYIDRQLLVIHLGMSGRLLPHDADAYAAGPHDHVRISTDDGRLVAFQDHRRPFQPPPSLTKRDTEVQMCRVLNKHTAGRCTDAIYIGRGSKWGNPFRIGVDGDSAAVIAKHAAGCGISITCCARSTNFAARICCASARRRHATAICCCGSPTRHGRSASRGGARLDDRRPHIAQSRAGKAAGRSSDRPPPRP